MSLDFDDFALKEELEADSLMVAICRSWYNGEH